MNNAYAVWSESKQRANMDVLSSDIEQAISWFKKQFGTEPKLMLLHKKCQYLADSIPETIKVEYHHALAHEIFLSAAEKVGIDKSELKNAGSYFFCQSCLVDNPLDDQSFDERYCQQCCEFLLDEAAQLSQSKKPAWIPRRNQKIDAEKSILIADDAVLNMSTRNDDKIQSGHISPIGPLQRSVGKRGPKFHDDLPIGRIHELAAQSQGAKAIASELKGMGIIVSYKTIQRILDGQRMMI